MYIKKLVGKKCYLSPIDIRNGKKHNVILMDIIPEDFYACRKE